MGSGFRCLAQTQPCILPPPYTRRTPGSRLPPLFVSSRLPPFILSSLPPCPSPSFPDSLPPCLLFPAACPHSLSFEGSGFFSCVSVFFNLDLSNFSISAMSGLSDMLAGDSAHGGEGRARYPRPGLPGPRGAPACGAAPAAPNAGTRGSRTLQLAASKTLHPRHI